MNQESTSNYAGRLRVQWLAVGFALLLAACGGATESKHDPGDEGLGSETNWLQRCDADADCTVGACHCGVCTRTCEGDAECTEVAGSECIAPERLGDCEVVPQRPICATEAALETANEGFSLGESGSDGGSESTEPDSQPGSEATDGGSPLEPFGGDGGRTSLPAEAEASPEAEPTPVAEPSPSAPSPTESPAPDGSSSTDDIPRADPSKVDLLLVVDNSLAMTTKQALLEAQMLEFTGQLVEPPCLGADGTALAVAPSEACPDGTVRSHTPVEDLHVGTITTSLGGYGSEVDCMNAEEGDTDNAHLLGSIVESSSEGGFYRYCSAARAAAGDCEAADDALVHPGDVSLAGETGCGWESSLESWYRLLVDPSPWTRITRQNCPYGADTSMLCNGPEIEEASGLALVDTELLAQRDAFLRPDSTLIVLLLTDENDCSFRADGQSWRLAQTFRRDSQGERVPSRAYRAAEVCATSPNSPCCVSCGAALPAGCPTVQNAGGEMVSVGCESPIYESADDLAAMGSFESTEDAVNLRCFQQKQRFGVDYLYPVERYSRALSSPELCPYSASLDPAECIPADVIANPLFAARAPADVIIAGIVGAPWQDLAADPTGDAPLSYRTASRSSSEGVEWSWLIGEREPEDGIVRPEDPAMLDSVERRDGTQPSTGASLTEDWNILDLDDLQFACTFPLEQPRQCPSLDDLDAGVTVSCDCTYYYDAAYEHPLCRTPDSDYGLTQYRAGAHPALRQLQVLYDVSEQAVVASICPKETADTAAPDYGYRPATTAILKKLGERGL